MKNKVVEIKIWLRKKLSDTEAKVFMCSMWIQLKEDFEVEETVEEAKSNKTAIGILKLYGTEIYYFR